MQVLSDLVGRAAAEAGLDVTAPVARHAAVYLAGADLPVEVTMLQGRVTRSGWAEETIVDNDTFALLRAGTESPDRVAVVCGGGINCVGRSATGATVRFPSLGRVSGDWGGGSFLGMEALYLAIRAEDGRGAATGLRDAVLAHLGRGSVAEVSAALHLGDISQDRVHELVPVLFLVANTGDQVARSVVDRLAEEVLLLATVALRRLDLLDRRADVVLGGGVLAARDPLLLDSIERQLALTAPGASIRIVDDPPVVGAALLGLDALGAPVPVADALRQQLLTRARTALPVRP
jgi:N-acetylglucosamine kinase-like BadF-type ATPase